MYSRSWSQLRCFFLFLLFLFISGHSYALTFELNKLIHVPTPIHIPITYHNVSKYGLEVDIPLSEVVQQELCIPGNCMQGALDAGAAYQKSFAAVGYDEIIVYYNAEGEVVGSAADIDEYYVPPPNQTAGGGVQLVGSVPGEFNVSSTGAAEYSIPIELPPGTAGVQPQLSINYNSQGGNGLLGIGWSIGGLSVIHRCPTTLAKDGFIDGIDFDSNDRFCLDGQPLVAVNGVYGANNTEYRTEIDGFSKIVSRDADGVNGVDSFTVYTKSGDVMEYGNTSDSLQNPPLANGTIQANALCWLLNKVTDSVGNYMTITYFDDEATGENYPLRIDYTGNNSQSLLPYNTVNFVYETRTDASVKYLSGKVMQSNKRLNKITIDSNALTSIAAYNLTYEYSDETSRSRITKIQRCDANDDCVPATTISYEQHAKGWIYDSNYLPPFDFVRHTSDGYQDQGVRVANLNGDGLDDLVMGIRWSTNSTRNARLNSGSGWSAASNYAPDYDFSRSTDNGYKDHGSRLVDLNADGLQDQLIGIRWSTNSTRDARLNSGSGWSSASSYASPFDFIRTTSNGYEDYGTRLVDLDGDGLQDIVQSIRWSTNSSRNVRLNSGSGWVSAPNYIPPFDFIHSTSEGYQDYGTRLVDLNGDGLQDIIQSIRWSTNSTRTVRLNSGTGWVTASNYAPPLDFVRAISSVYEDFGTRLVDLNGDGLQDIVQAIRWKDGSSSRAAYLNTGAGWISAPQFKPPLDFIRHIDSSGNGYEDYGTRFVDLNGDGLQDIVRSIRFSSNSSRSAYINTGSGWVSASVYAPLHDFVRHTDNGYEDYGTRLMDLNGDGLQDMVQSIRWTDGTSGRYVRLNRASIPDLAVNITNGLGISIDIDYKPLTDSSVYTKGSSATYPDQDIQNPMYVVSQSRTDNGVGSQNTLDYTYAGAKANLHGRGFLGFASRIVEDASTGTIVTTNFRQDFPFTGIVSSTETRHGATLLSRETNTHASSVTGTSTETGSTDPVFIYTSQSVAESFDLDTGVLITTTTTTSTYDGYGNPTQIIATTNDIGEPSFVVTTNNTYVNDTTSNKWHLGRLTDADVTKSLGGVASPTRSSSFEYDAVTGFLTKEIIQPGSSMELMKTYVHDGYGNRVCVVTTGSDITSLGNVNECQLGETVIHPATAGRITTTSYDSQGRFATTATNALGHTETREYDPLFNQGWGQVTKLTGPNNLATVWEYDTLGRKIKEMRADGTVTDISYSFCDGSCPVLANDQRPSYFVTTINSGAPSQREYYDTVNRLVLVKTQSFNGDDVFVQTEFDARARVARTSLPYFGNTPDFWTVNTYDTLDRLTQENAPDTGITTYSFNGLETTVTNDLLQEMKERKNSRGQTLWSDDDDGNRVSFTYDAAGNLTHVSDGTNVTINTYDLRGFKETMDDPDMGVWKYEYNVLGELIKQWDAKTDHSGPATVVMTYDVLGRLESRAEPEGTTTWTYDDIATGGAKAIGKLTTVHQPHDNFTRHHHYDGLGREDHVQTLILGGQYDVYTDYDTFSRVDEITYPSGYGVKYQYTSLGYLHKVVDAINTSTVHWEATGMNNFGNITTSINGGIVSEKVYEPNSGRLEKIITGFTTIQDLQYDYDNLGNLKQRKDHIQNLTEDFVYDDLNRLKSATVVGVGTAKTFVYDALGNITNKSDVGNYTAYGAEHASCGADSAGIIKDAGPHAVTSIDNGAINYCYDANGNMESGNDRTISWSSYNKPIQIARGQGQAQKIVSFNYGPDRARFRQVASDNSTTKTTTYIGGLYEQIQITGNSNKEHKHFIRANGQTIGIHTSYDMGESSTEYLHRDHLGSIDVITDSSLNVVNGERFSFDAFGQRRESNWSNAIDQITSDITTRGYTGHEQLDSVGLIHMNGRVYDPQLGRFLSADPFVQQPKNYQSLNRYTYVQNNPLSYTDPSGFFVKKLKKAIKKAVKSISKAVSSVVSSAARIVAGAAFNLAGSALNAINSNVITSTIAQAVACARPDTCAAYTAASTYAATGSLTASLKAGAIAFGTVEISGHIGKAKGLDRVQKAFAHGAVGGTIAELQGGKFTQGFASSFVAKLGSGKIKDHFGVEKFSDRVQGAVAAATLAGTVSVITGGKFVNGARTAAIQYLYNELKLKRAIVKTESRITQTTNKPIPSIVLGQGGPEDIEERTYSANISECCNEVGTERSREIIFEQETVISTTKTYVITDSIIFQSSQGQSCPATCVQFGERLESVRDLGFPLRIHEANELGESFDKTTRFK